MTSGTLINSMNLQYVHRIIILIMLTLSGFPGCFSLPGQEVGEKMPAKAELKYGPKAGLDFTAAEKWYSMKGHDPGESFLGVSGGIATRIIWRGKWYIQPEFMLEYNNASTHVKISRTESEGEDVHHEIYDISRFALQLPVHLGYKFTLAGDYCMSVFTGIFVQYGIAGMFESHNDSDILPHYSLYGKEGVWNRWNFGPLIGLTFEIGDSFVVSVDGNIGIRKMNRKNIFADHTLNESIGRVGFTYWIR